MANLKNIKNIYPLIDDKVGFCEEVSGILSPGDYVKPISIYNNWFRNFWGINEKYLDKITDMAQKTIKNQTK